MTTYRQPTKNIARKKLIKESIKYLTKGKDDSILVNEKNFSIMTEHYTKLIDQFLRSQRKYLPDSTLSSILENWNSFYKSKVIYKKPSDLKVLYLSGPEPTNDLKVFLENGISPYNIWAVEKETKYFNDALYDLKSNNIFIKIHKGSLKSFFESYPETFDIIYYDACNSLISDSNNPLDVLQELFLGRRLDSHSVLITNFSEPDISTWEEWSQIFASWYSVRDEGVPTSLFESEFADKDYRYNNIKEFAKYTKGNLPEFYSDFIRRFIPIFASDIIPYLRIISFDSVNSKFFKDNKILNSLLAEENVSIDSIEDLLKNVPHHLLSESSYPLFNFARMIKSLFEGKPKNGLYNFLFNKKEVVFKSILVFSILKNYEEHYSGYNTWVNKICKPNLMKTIHDSDFFDKAIPLTCDVPMKNLIIELIIGQYGFPYIANAKTQLSLKYKAKETWMYSDVFVLDQSRYLYDLIPSIDLFSDFFNQDLFDQIKIRVCIDLILKNHHDIDNHLFRGGTIESLYNFNSVPYSSIKKRENINNSI
ncbi:hypothetical protein [Aquibacillus rhizosphaerae]|uniref:Class I SAM-dependent methyltransferase n=1 Tax=Aquibacillus rhizosphaerae TaxID=3051431 RepID=A0ABT7L3B8_9BACI|nr:hypothetical protein [Aquibacillus sp. LR5S19]MDL4840356.1 hypothetical protein [Aquibacillus sp. LR5S19]